MSGTLDGPQKISHWSTLALSVFLAIGLALAGFTNSAQAIESSSPLSLGEGHVGRFWWSASVEAPEKGFGTHETRKGEVCLSISMAGLHEGNEVAQCALLSPRAPMIESFTEGPRGRHKTALAMLFASGARRLYLKLAGRPGRMINLQELTQEELGSISSSAISYFAHGYAGRFCIQRYVTYDAFGNAIVESGRSPCPKPPTKHRR